MEVIDVNLNKSANDKKSYRLIRLKNGLQVLLISYPENEDDPKVLSESDKESSGSSEDELSDEEDEEESNGKEMKSAASLCVGVGSFSDPDEIPGFAHFLEHMVFMGSKPFPKENDFDDYVTKHGGDSNACTDCEMTMFYFEIQRKYFRRCLEKLSQFFISPLLKEDCVNRETEAVDSEFQMTTSSDNDRVNQLISATAKQGHPMSKFMAGNAKSLKHDPAKNGLNVYSRLRNFYENMYCSNYMTLVLQSMDNLDTLQEWANDIFLDVPSTTVPRPSFSHLTEPFNTVQFKKFYKVVPMENNHKLEISWPMPSMVQKYRSKPLEYLSTLILHEGKGSILSLLKKHVLALSMSGGSETDGFGHNSTWSLFYISITLTDRGLKNILEVCSIVFQYINMLKKQGPQERLFHEFQQTEDSKFRFKEQGDPMDDVLEISESMQVYAPEHYLSGRYLLFEYDAQSIDECTQLLLPERANFVLLTTDMSMIGEPNGVEEWYGTKYNVQDVDPTWLKTWENLEENPDLFFPEPNVYIGSDFTLLPSESKAVKAPKLLVDNEYCKMWYKKDAKFEVPKGYTYVHLMSPVVSESIESATLNDLFVNILLNILSETVYPAVLAGYEYSVEGFTTGIVITVDGLNEKMPLVFQSIVDHFADLQCSEDLFTAIQAQLKKAYYNELIKPYELARMLRFGLLDPLTQPIPHRYEIVSQFTHADLMKFLDELKNNLFIEGFVIGNCSEQEVTQMAEYVQKRLCTQPLPPERIPKKVLLALPSSEMKFRVKNPNKDDHNSCIINYYQVGPSDIRSLCVNELMLTRMKEPCFDFLRTKHQLGYSVFSLAMLTNGIAGLSIVVESQSSKHSLDSVEKLMTDFMAEFKTTVDSLTEEEFEDLVDSLIESKRMEDTHLGEEANRLWREIQDQFYVFDILEKEITALEKISLKELKAWFNQYMKEGRSKLSVQIEGNTKCGDNAENDSNTESLVILKVDDNFIEDILATKQGLKQFPYTRITV